ncbi:hypothetical protein ANO14919_113550 [Xylariales sp. No.14919]|nr:hypothetical protein ANO14919_113550 [Xylariales sp. No.14919]
MFFAKYTVLPQIESIFYKHQQSKGRSRLISALIWANLFFYLAIFFAFVFACVPRSKITNPTLPGRCISTNASILATSAINVVSDISILIIPTVAVWNLQLTPRKKFGVSVVFAVGIFACIACVVRLYYSVKLTQSEDATWHIEPVGSWALAEFTTVILVACFPVLPRLFIELRNRNGAAHYELSDTPEQSKMSFTRRRGVDTSG